MAILVQDGFSGTAGTINARTPDTVNTPGGTWTAAPTSGGIEVDGSGAALWTTSTNNARILTNVSTMRVQVDFDPGGSTDNRGGILVSNNAAFAAGNQYFFNFRPITNTLELIRQPGATLLASATPTIGAGNFTYALEYTGATGLLECFIGSTKIISTTDTTHPALTYAMFMGALHTDGGGRFDDFIVDNMATLDSRPMLSLGVGA